MGLFAWILIICEGMFVIQKKVISTISDDIQRLDMVRQLYLRIDPLIQNAGFLGMQSVNSGLPILLEEGMPYSQMPMQALTLHRWQGNRWVPPLPAVLTSKVASGTDVMIIEFANPQQLPKAGWFVKADGGKADIFYSEHVPEYKSMETVVSAWQITALYMQKSDEGLELMQKTLLPMADAVGLIKGFTGFQWQTDGGLLKLNAMYKGEWMSLWFGPDNAY